LGVQPPIAHAHDGAKHAIGEFLKWLLSPSVEPDEEPVKPKKEK